MPILSILIILIVAGVALYLINKYIPMDRTVKKILNIVVIIIVVVWLLKIFGVWDSAKSLTI